MSGVIPVRRALISVSDKADLVPFARALADAGVEIVSTGGTAAALQQAGVKVIPIEQVTGVPEMMDGRVKSLHPAIHGALLARRDKDEHVAAMNEHGITPIDMICVNLYPFERTVAQEDVTWNDAIEQIDIGGPCMLRSAAKNHDYVAVVTAPTQYDHVVNELHKEGGTTLELRRELAAAAFTRTAAYDTAIAMWMSERGSKLFPSSLQVTYAHQANLRYGENPHQKAAVYATPGYIGPSAVTAKQLAGKELSYNNLNDAAAALDLVRELHEAFEANVGAAIIKHTNPCGAAIGDTLAEAIGKAHEGDPLAAFGGILAVNRDVDVDAAQCIIETAGFLEVIIAPSFGDAAARALSAKWKNARLLAAGDMRRRFARLIDYHSIPGGLLAQEHDVALPDVDHWQHIAGPAPDDAMLHDAAFTWLAAKHLKSNAIAIGADGAVLGIGCGQVDRVTACKLAVEKAGEKIAARDRPIAASDAFFPFDDGPKVLIDAGVKCIVHPGGSMRDEDTFKLCERHGVTCLLTGVRHFRH